LGYLAFSLIYYFGQLLAAGVTAMSSEWRQDPAQSIEVKMRACLWTRKLLSLVIVVDAFEVIKVFLALT
jgi:hypothetical protein